MESFEIDQYVVVLVGTAAAACNYKAGCNSQCGEENPKFFHSYRVKNLHISTKI